MDNCFAKFWLFYVKLQHESAISSVSSVAQSCPTLCNPINRSTPGLPVYHQPPEFTQTQVHRFGDAIQPSHPLSSPSPPAPNPSQHQSFPMSQLFAWGGQSTGVSALASFLPKNTQGWSPSEWTGWTNSYKDTCFYSFLLFIPEANGRASEEQIRNHGWR